MKKLLNILFFIPLIFFSQEIKITKEIKNPKKYEAYLDSTKNFNNYKSVEQVLGMINQKIYFYPKKNGCSENLIDSNFFGISFYKIDNKNNKIKIKRDIVEGKYATIKEIKFLNNSFSNNEYISIENWEKENYYKKIENLELYLTLENQENIIAKIKSFMVTNDYFITIPYYNYLTKKYNNKKVLFRELKKYDIDNYDKEINENDVYISEFSLKESNSKYCYPNPTVILKNDFNHYEILTDNDLMYYKLNYIVDYENYLYNLNKYKNDLLDEIQEKEKEAIVKYNRNLKKYGKKIADRIKNNEVWIGMSRELLIESLGFPLKINRTILKNYEKEQFVYKNIYVYVENNIVTAFQD